MSSTTSLIILSSSSISNPPPLPKHPPSTITKPTPKHSHHRPLLTTVHFPKHPHKQNTNYYAQLASKLAEEAKFNDFFMIVETVSSTNDNDNGGVFLEYLNGGCVSKGLVSLVESGELRKLVSVLGGFEKLGIKGLVGGLVCEGAVFDAVRRECRKGLKCGELEVVLDLLEVLSGYSLSIEDVLEPVEVIRTCVYKKNPRAAIRYAGLCTRSDEIFCKAILEFGKRGDMASARTVFEASKDNLGCVNMYAYRTIIDVCGLCRDHLRSRSIYEGLSAQNINPNLYVFNSLMNVNACDLNYTMFIYKHMQNLGVVPDIASYNILLKSCCLAARLDTAQEIYREVEDLESKGSLKLDVFTYSTMIKPPTKGREAASGSTKGRKGPPALQGVYADARMWQMALGMKDKMVEAGVTPNAVTWSSLISACAKAGLVDQALVLFEEMLLAGCMPNSQCCNVLLYACVQAFQYDRAFRLFHSWKSNSFQITNRSLTQGSSQVVPMKVPFKPTTATYNVLMKACGTDHFLAKALMEEMETVGLSPNHISFSTLIGVYGGSGDVKNAVQVLKTMRESDVPPDVIAYTAAIKVKYILLSAKSSILMDCYTIVTYNTLLRARTRYGSLIEVQQCLSIYRDMRKAGFKPNDYYLKELIEEWCEGIIQDNNRSQGRINSSNKRDLGGPQSLLLEKVASHLEMGNAEAQSIAVDVQGLTKVEARIVVLAVLRMIKENYNPGDYVRDDMFIILGVQELGTAAEKHQIDVRDTIIKLLRDNLGLEVLSLGPKIPTDIRINVENPFNPHPDLDKTLERSRLPTSPTRRPAVLQRLKVTRRSLYHWLQRKFNA
ncbi:pentatricopeptide repeat-containing protein [Tanacetum coccineum]